MDALFAPYLFPNERYFVGAIAFCIVVLLLMRQYVSNRKKSQKSFYE